MSRFSITAIMMLAIPAFAAAQHRGGAVGRAPVAPSRPATVVPRAAPSSPRGNMRVQPLPQSAPRAGAPVSQARITGRSMNRGNGAGFQSNGTNSQNVPGLGFGFGSNGTNFQNNVPGLGFDYPHLAAINGNRPVEGGRFDGEVPFGFGGFLLNSPGYVDEGQQPVEPPLADTQVSVEDQNAAADANAAAEAYYAQRARRQSEGSRAPADPQPQAAPAPQPDVEQYVFVRRDGGVVFGVAYTWDNGTLRYVTPEGIRRSIGRDALDLKATQQFNEERGLTFQAPA
jgi:hypothetical protein